MSDRVGQIRKAAAFVFRHYPSVLRQATSAYGRRRAQHREKKRRKGGKT